MVSFDCRCTHNDGVTLVTAAITGLSEPTRVTVVNRLDGPVWPPRRQGISEAGWHDTGFEAVVSPGRTVLGYATPATPEDQPAELVDVTPVPDGEPTADRLGSVEAVCRELGDPSPPREAVAACSTAPRQRDPTGTDSLPAPLAPWLDQQRRRVDTAEALDSATSLSEATAAVDRAGGLAGVRRLASSASADEQTLRTVARRAEKLADRRAATTVPAETLARLA